MCDFAPQLSDLLEARQLKFGCVLKQLAHVLWERRGEHFETIGKASIERRQIGRIRLSQYRRIEGGKNGRDFLRLLKRLGVF